jgi:IS5 family transposase
LEEQTTFAGYIQRQASRAGKAGQKSKKRLKTVANVQLRELDRKMSEKQKAFYREKTGLYHRAVNQQKSDIK